MLKECLVLKNNPAVTVVLFGDKEIQLPAINREARFVKDLFEDGKYTAVPDDYKEPTKQAKKTTIDETIAEKAKIDVESDLK